MCISPIFENREIPVFEEALFVCAPLGQLFKNNERKDVLLQADALAIFLQNYPDELLESEVTRYINPFLMQRIDTGMTLFSHLYSIGHPVITSLKDKLGGQIWEKIIYQNNGRYPLVVQAINHLFQTAVVEFPKENNIDKWDKCLYHLSLVNDKLMTLFLAQIALISGEDAAAKEMLAKMDEDHFLLLTRLPGVQKLFFQKICESFSEAVQKNLLNIVEYPIFFAEDKVQKSAIQELFSPVSFLRDPNFNIVFSVVAPVYFWHFAKSNNPIVHQVLGMVFDQLTYMQKQMYLKALVPTMFPFFVKSLRPENFAEVLKILPNNQLKFFNHHHCTVRFLLSEDEGTILSRAVQNKEQSVAIALVLWVNPGIKELQRWVQALEQVKEDKARLVAVLKTKLEKKLNFYRRMNECSKNCLIDIRNLQVDYCQISEAIPESPILLSGKIFDKSSLMEQRPLVNPVTGDKFSFFDLTYQGTVEWRNDCLRTRVFNELRSLNQKVQLLKSQRIGYMWSIKE